MTRIKWALCVGFLLMGFTFTVTQGLLVRELLVAFLGNELSIGLVLGNWLVLEAIGSGLLGKLADRRRPRGSAWGQASAFAALQILFALFLPPCLYGAYASRQIAGAIPGEGVGLVPLFYSSALPLLPLALIDGAMFTFGCRAYATLGIGMPPYAGHGGASPRHRDASLRRGDRDALPRESAPTIGRVYVYEAGGAIAGGIVFTYLWLPFLYSVQIALLLSGLNLLSAASILASSGRSAGKGGSRTVALIAVLVALAADLGLLLSPLAREAQQWANSQQWSGYDLVYSQNSAYGNVAVVQREAQYTFYADGIPILTAPVPDVALSEEMVHLPLLFVPQPRRALVLSGGAGGVLYELLKYPLEQIDYAELDPLLIQAIHKFPTPLTRSELGDPRVTVEGVDGRLLVREKGWKGGSRPQGRYDVVIVNLPYPSTLQLNRFYTVEFYQSVRRLLAEDGILVTICPGTLTYMSDELRDLNAMAYHSLREAFPYVRPIPGEVTLWLASPADAFSAAPAETLVRKWEERGLDTKLLTPAHIRLKLDQRRLDWFWASLGTGGKVNRDLHPVGLLCGLAYWNALFAPDLARIFASAGRLSWWMLSLPIAGCILLLVAAIRLSAKSRAAIVPTVIVTTGFTGMAADLIVVFAFQTLYGHVYHWIGLLITAFMVGLSLGGWLVTRGLARIQRERSALLKLELALVLYWGLLPIALSGLRFHTAHALGSVLVQGALLLLNAMAGLLVGSQFPLANRMWLKGQGKVRGAAGLLYACDLAGAFLGSLLVSVILIPVLGIVETCLLAAAIKLGSLLLVVLPSINLQAS